MTFLPIISTRILSGTNLSTGIVTRSLSVMFINSFDDQSISKSESNSLKEDQSVFLKDILERVDKCRDHDKMNFIRYLPWIEQDIASSK